MSLSVRTSVDASNVHEMVGNSRSQIKEYKITPSTSSAQHRKRFVNICHRNPRHNQILQERNKVAKLLPEKGTSMFVSTANVLLRIAHVPSLWKNVDVILRHNLEEIQVFLSHWSLLIFGKDKEWSTLDKMT